MPDVIFIADRELIAETDGSPAEGLPTMHCHSIFQGARAQLYALLTGSFYDEALELEVLVLHGEGSGPMVYELDTRLVDTLANLEEDDTAPLIAPWQETAEIEAISVDDSDLSDFLFSLIHLCQIARNETDLSVFVLSDG